MADNSPLLKWLASVAGLTNLYSAGPIPNPTEAPTVMFSVSAPKNLFVHRITIVNDSSIPEIYVLQYQVAGEAWEELARLTVEPGLTWRGDYTIEMPLGNSIRMAIVEDPAATGNSWAHLEYLEESASK